MILGIPALKNAPIRLVEHLPESKRVLLFPMHNLWRISPAVCAMDRNVSIFDMVDFSNHVRSDNVFILDGCSEGSAFNVEWFSDFLSKLPDGISPGRFIFVHTNRQLKKDMTAWCDARGIAAPGHVIWNYFAHQVISNFSHAGVHSALSERSPDSPYSVLCLNNKPRPYRTKILSEIMASKLPLPALLSWRTARKGDLPSLPPDIAEVLSRDNRLSTHRMSGVDLIYNIDDSLYRKTFFSLVTESNMGFGKVKRITEKSLKPILGRHPFLVAGCPGVLRILRDLGLRTFSPHIDESYDLEVNQNERLKMVVAETIRIASLGRRERARFISDCADIVQDNFEYAHNGLLRNRELNVFLLTNDLYKLVRQRQRE